MGGWGSGRHWLSRKTTVEQCLMLDVNKLVKGDLLDKSFAELRWCRGEKEIASVSYTVKAKESVLTLHPPLAQNIPLVVTRPHPGGKRYWFSCPNCRRRVGRLYLPHGRNWFFCRRCWDLTYRSSQQAHSFDSFFLKVGIPPRVGNKLIRRK